MRAKHLFVAGLIVLVVCLGLATPSEASQCWDEFEKDTAICLQARQTCIETESFWTRTCNLDYLICEAGAELKYADCNLDAIVAMLEAFAQ